MLYLKEFMELCVWVPMGFNEYDELEEFNKLLDDTKKGHKPYIKFGMFFEDSLTEEKIQEFVSAVNEKYPDNEIKIYKDIAEKEMQEIYDFCTAFNEEE